MLHNYYRNMKMGLYFRALLGPPRMVQRLGRVGDEVAESYPSRPAPRRVRVTSRLTQLRGDRLGRESELTRSTRHHDDDFVPHRNSMWK